MQCTCICTVQAVPVYSLNLRMGLKLSMAASIYCPDNNKLVKNTETWKKLVHRLFFGKPTPLAALIHRSYFQHGLLISIVVIYGQQRLNTKHTILLENMNLRISAERKCKKNWAIRDQIAYLDTDKRCLKT